MLRRIAILSVAAITISTGTGAAVTAPPGAPAWQSATSGWAPADSVRVAGVYASASAAWVAGDLEVAGHSTPIVQRCTSAGCAQQKLPRTAGSNAYVNAISGTSKNDVWAVGGILGKDAWAPIIWHYDGAAWQRVKAKGLAGDHNLLNVVAVSRRESYAAVDTNFGAGGTITIFRRLGKVWTEVSPLSAPTFPGECASWYTNAWDELAVVGRSPVLLGYCEDVPTILQLRGNAWIRIDGGLPSGSWHDATAVGGRIWVSGIDNTGAVSIQQRKHGQWSAVTTHGIDAGATVDDLTGRSRGNLWAVGWVPSAAGTTAASWRWANGRWHQVAVPTRANHRTTLDHASVSGRHAWSAGYDLTSAKGLVFRSR